MVDLAAGHFGIAMPLLVVDAVLLVILVASFIQAKGDITKVPQGLLVAYDHSMSVGVMTNVLFGIVLNRRRVAAPVAVADHLVFWLLNVGLVGFLGVLLFAGYDSDLVKLTAPVMAIGPLLRIATFSLSLNAVAGEAAPAMAPSRA